MHKECWNIWASQIWFSEGAEGSLANSNGPVLEDYIEEGFGYVFPRP